MSSSQSNLSDPHYGYDFVVATTQASVNATMKLFLSGLTEPVVTVLYVANDQGKPVQVELDQLLKSAKGSNPFNVPANANVATDQDLKNLFDAKFMMGFKAQLGLPPGLPPAQIPDIVTLGRDTSAVSYNMLCSQFQVVELNPGGYGPPSWTNQSQPAGKPWIFTSKVDLRLSTVAASAYDKLPSAVQQQIKNLSSTAFSIQQLLFDLDNAALQTIPTIAGVTPGTPLYTMLEQYFVGAYFSEMQKGGTPLLGCAIVPHGTTAPSTLTMTDLNMEVSPFLSSNGQPVINPTTDQQNLATLNYLCAANGDPLPAPATFAWNWIDPTEEADADGVAAINRSTFATFFRNQLQSHVPANCYLPSVSVTYDWTTAKVNYSYTMTPGQAPKTVTMPTSGSTILAYHYDADSSDYTGSGGDPMGEMDLHPAYDVTVSYSGNVLSIVQHLVVYISVTVLSTTASGNVVDITLTDDYTMAVTQDGRLTATLTPNRRVNSQDPSTNPFLNFWTGVNGIIEAAAGWAQSFTSPQLADIPVSVAQSFVFPGGKTFAFKSAAFSASGDLTSHITYADPS